MDSNAALAAVINGLMKAKGLSQPDLAREANISKPTLQRRLSPYDAMKYPELVRIARVLGKRPSELVAAAEQLEAAL